MRTLIPWIIIGLSLAGGVALIIWNALRGDEEEEIVDGVSVPGALATTAAEVKKDDLATTTEEYRGSARKSRILSMKASFEKSLDTTIGPRASTKDRMTMPWFLLVGADGSGKRTVLANNGLPLPYGPPMEVDSHRKDAGKWWLFEDAVVLEAPAAAPGTTSGTATLAPDQTVADASIGWHTLVHMLRRERPDSPLNGIIVTISCADLLSARANPEKLSDQAERIRAFLERTRKTLGVRLPLHVLVTKCDTLPGFKTFAQTLPEGRRDDIFGWANPNDIEAPFDPAWIDTGFESLRANLADLRDELLAAPEQMSDTVGIFVFDGEFVDMQEPLRDFVSKLTVAGERRPPLFFRGMYFTGDAIEVPEDQAVTIRASAALSGELELPQNHSLVFLKSLFQDKIFKEAGLARPAARFRLARDRRVVIAQAAALLLLLGGSFGLWTSVYGLRRDTRIVRTGLRYDAQAIARVLSGLAIDLDEVKRDARPGAESVLDRRSRDAAVIELVGQMREVPTMRVRSAFLPTSWFSPLPNDIRTSMMRGVQGIVLPVTRQRLQERSDRLLGVRNGAGDASGAPELDVSDPRSLATYLTDVRTLSRNIERYNSLASPTSGSVAELSALLDYLFGERFSADSALRTPDFESALRSAAGPRIIVSPAMAASVVNRAVATVSSVASSAGRQLAPRAPGQGERARDAEEDLMALVGLAGLVDLVDPRTGLVATVSDSAILGVKLARLVQDSVEAQLRFAAARIRRDTVSPADAADSLKRVVGELFKFRLMAPIEGRVIVGDLRSDERLRWDVGRLELALALRGEYLQAVISLTSAFPGQPPERLRRALEVQLRARSIDVAAGAQRFTPGAGENMLEVRSEAANLEAASARIVRLATLFDSMSAGRQGKLLVAAGARQAEHTLAMAQTIVDRQRYFAPQTAKIAAWQGVIPVSYAALGVTDSLNFFTTLINHTTDVRTLAHDVAPALRFLRLSVVDTLHAPKLLASWEELANSVSRYERGDYTSSLGMLWRFLREGMSATDVSSCASAAYTQDEPRFGSDLFTLRRQQLHAALVGRCRGGSADAAAAYSRMRMLFASRLAGRFPFADSTQAARAADADPAAIRELLRLYDAFAVSGDIALRSDPRLTQTARGAMAFLDQMAQVRAFMAPLAESADRKPPEFNLIIGSTPDDEREVRWRFGDSVHVSTAVDSLGNEQAVYVRGGWAPLRYALSPRDTVATIRFFHPETKIELIVPTGFPSFAPEIVLPKPR